jgi:hypothetical protein
MLGVRNGAGMVRDERVEPLNTFARQLRRHAERRRAGVPTVTLALGSFVEHTARLRRCLAGEGSDIVVAEPAPPEMLARTWIDSLTGRRDLRETAFSAIAGARPELSALLPAQWSSRTPRERELWLTQLMSDTRAPSAQGALGWLRDRSSALGMTASSDNPLRVLSRLTDWVSASAWPALLVTASSAPHLEALVTLAIAVPRLPLLAVVDEQRWTSERSRLCSRTRSLLSEGVVLLRDLPETADPDHAILPPPDIGATEGASTRPQSRLALLFERADGACRRANALAEENSEEDPEASELARSLAELLLSEMLERDVVTRGLFALNATLPFEFGTQPAEVDLLCRSLDLAVEVDGYFHFTNPARYRRDRRKDLLLQTHGFWVARYLATDVVDRGDDVVSSIRTLIQRRKPTTARTGK